MFPLLFLAALTPAAPAVQVDKLDESSFLLSLPADVGDVARLQTLVGPAAKRACAAARPVLGRYRFTTDKEKPRFEQELLCLPRGNKLDITAAADVGKPLEPSRSDQQAVLAASYAYFTAKDQGRYAEAHRLLSERARARSSFSEWAETARNFTREAGAPRGRRVVEITWYKDPTDAPEPGLYVAADFSGEFERLEFVCGYLMWRVQPDGSLVLAREEQNFAPKRGSGRAIAAIDRDPLRARMGCKD